MKKSGEKKEARPSIGGQAVMEGVMMNGRLHYSVSVRKPNGEIQTELFDNQSVTEKHAILSVPVVRGVIRFAESLIIGMKTLNYSAEFFMEEESEEKKKERSHFWQTYGERILMACSMILAVVLCLGIFVALPVGASRLLYTYVTHNVYWMGLTEGILRMLLFLLYLFLVSKVKDIARTFEYHGAEHKTINCLEAGESLTPEHVKKYSRFNKRCGTSFLFIIMLISILFFSFIQVTDPLVRFALHLLLIPVIAGVSYEVLKFSAKSESRLINILVAPGLLIQRITTKEPDEEQIEVAIASVKKVLEAEYPDMKS